MMMMMLQEAALALQQRLSPWGERERIHRRGSPSVVKKC